MNKTVEQITMYEALERYFDRPFKCKVCGDILYTITGISVHWRKMHQHNMRVSIIRVKGYKKEEV